LTSPLLSLRKHQRRDTVHPDARGRDPRHRGAMGLGGCAESPVSFPRHGAHRDQEHDGVRERREHGRTSKAVRVQVRGSAAREHRRAPRLARPSTSLRLCAASASSAVECASTPNSASSATKGRVRPMARRNARRAGCRCSRRRVLVVMTHRERPLIYAP
jgi:hypothetical protein